MTVKSVRILQDGFFTINKGLLIYAKTQYYGQQYRAALKPLLIESRDHWILVDTGMGKINEKYAKFYLQERTPSLEGGLESAGLSPKDISVVINTHLHFDHCGNNKLFPEAEFLVQEGELEYARNPHRFQKGGYLKELFDSVEYTEVRGEKKVCDGVRVIPTPGHTPGHQSVVVELGETKYVYCGDVAPVRENIEERNIVGILHNPVQALESIDLLIGLGGTYIYSHDNEQLSI
jgi:glyoxylase-like metal-dependent hydrolase (beta-lactamase superfamily II)